MTGFLELVGERVPLPSLLGRVPLSCGRRYNKSKLPYPGDFEETVRFWEGSALFAGITPEQLRTVAASATIENHPAGSIVTEEDGASDYFYLIVEGKVIFIAKRST